jgi:hypothetical protein
MRGHAYKMRADHARRLALLEQANPHEAQMRVWIERAAAEFDADLDALIEQTRRRAIEAGIDLDAAPSPEAPTRPEDRAAVQRVMDEIAREMDW